MTWLVVILAVLSVVMFLSVTIGSRSVSLEDVFAAIGGSIDGFDQAAVAKRIPRTVLAVLAGLALAVSGTVMQGVTRNPLADPGILGVNMGASVAVVAGIAYFGLVSASSFIWVGILGCCCGGAVRLRRRITRSRRRDPAETGTGRGGYRRCIVLIRGRDHAAA
ncbi:MAG: iron chelate uptake ABC transporter family permease subunit [Cumulibacter sp.]